MSHFKGFDDGGSNLHHPFDLLASVVRARCSGMQRWLASWPGLAGVMLQPLHLPLDFSL